ncbi:MAG: 3D domain-containing protein [Clostridia bacterium]|nr:3D domain-containing protein [Clostridia bacterium]
MVPILCCSVLLPCSSGSGDLSNQLREQLAKEQQRPLATQKTKSVTSTKVTTVKPKASTVKPQSTVYKITAYCLCKQCCGKTDGITASGTKAKPGRTVAVDPRVIPLGSKVLIGGKTYIAEDTGNHIKGNRIDVLLSTHEQAIRHGVQNKPVVILGRT